MVQDYSHCPSKNCERSTGKVQEMAEKTQQKEDNESEKDDGTSGYTLNCLLPKTSAQKSKMKIMRPCVKSLFRNKYVDE